MNTGLKMVVGAVQRQFAGRITGKTNIGRGLQHLDSLFHDMFISLQLLDLVNYRIVPLESAVLEVLVFVS